jgi:hypothetical protein
MNTEIAKVKEWCNSNKLSINFSKTNFMIAKSARKKDIQIDIKIQNANGSRVSLERKDHIKYFEVMIGDTISWKYHIPYICSRVSRGIGIFSKLRHYLSITQLKQLYYNIIYPHISYTISVDNLCRLSALKFTHLWHKSQLPRIFDSLFQYTSDVHTYNTRYSSKKNLHKKRVRTNYGKQMTSFAFIDLWKDLPKQLKVLNVFRFSKLVK